MPLLQSVTRLSAEPATLSASVETKPTGYTLSVDPSGTVNLSVQISQIITLSSGEVITRPVSSVWRRLDTLTDERVTALLATLEKLTGEWSTADADAQEARITAQAADLTAQLAAIRPL